MSAPTRWAILTGEYPPQFGGVADYTRQVALGLAAAGDAVCVFAPPCAEPMPEESGVVVHRLPDRFGPRGLLALDDALAKARPDRVLVQYVPHAFGYKALNVPFAAWVAGRARRIAPVWVMFHEVQFPFAWRPRHAVLATAHAVMGRLVAGAADRVFVSVPGWARLIRGICPRAKPAEWLPIPSNVPVGTGPRPVGTGDRITVGHFGTYGASVVGLLEPVLLELLSARADRDAVLLGRGGPAFAERLVARAPALAGRVTAPGGLAPEDLAARLRACDVLVQPYIDGISTRRTSAMAGIANGVPVVSNLGEWAEPFWPAAEGVWVAPGPEPGAITAAAEAALTLSPNERADIGGRGAALYRARFSLENTIRTLRTTRQEVAR